MHIRTALIALVLLVAGAAQAQHINVTENDFVMKGGTCSVFGKMHPCQQIMHEGKFFYIVYALGPELKEVYQIEMIEVNKKFSVIWMRYST